MQNMSSVRFVSGGIKRRILKTNRDFLGGVLKKEAYYIEGGGERIAGLDLICTTKVTKKVRFKDYLI